LRETFGDTTYVWGVVANRIVAVHLIGKTVRFSYLMGGDERSGKNFDHRKRRIEEKLKTLADNFGIDLSRITFIYCSGQAHTSLRLGTIPPSSPP